MTEADFWLVARAVESASPTSLIGAMRLKIERFQGELDACVRHVFECRAQLGDVSHRIDESESLDISELDGLLALQRAKSRQFEESKLCLIRLRERYKQALLRLHGIEDNMSLLSEEKYQEWTATVLAELSELAGPEGLPIPKSYVSQPTYRWPVLCSW